jgi:hypothetical protein
MTKIISGRKIVGRVIHIIIKEFSTFEKRSNFKSPGLRPPPLKKGG